MSGGSSTLDDNTVLALVRRLESEDRPVDVVRLTEKWGYGRALPRSAMLAAARALFSLRLMDRALARLRTLTDADPSDVDALLLTAALMRERGWTARAQQTVQAIQAIQPDHPGLAALLDEGTQTPQELLANARAIERSGSHAQLLRLAEVYLATGSLLRGRTLLERLRRKRPDDDRVSQLLWGARGDLSPRPGPLHRLVEELSADAEADRLDEWEQADATENATFADVTMSSIAPPPPEQTRSPSFPRLFRQGGGGTDEAEPAEVTIAAHMASTSEMMEPPTEEVTESSLLDEDPDTRIMEIITNRRGEPEVVENRSQAVDLRALHEQADPETDMGAEDDGVVVMKRRTGPRPARAPTPDTATSPRRRPIEVIEKYPTPIVPPEPSELEPASLEPVTLPDAPPPLLPEVPDISLELDEPELPLRRPVSPALVVAGAALIAALGVGGVYYGMRAQAGRQVQARTASVLAEGDFGALRGLEMQLARQVASGQPPLGERAAALARVESVLWAEYTGDIEDLEDAREAIALAEEQGVSPEVLATPSATLALSTGRPEEAARLLAGVPADDEARYLAAQIAFAHNDEAAAAKAWPSPPPAGERYATVGDRIAGEGGFSIEGASLEMQIRAHEARWDDLSPVSRLEAVSALLSAASRTLSPRQRARLYIVAAELNEELGRENLARVSWEKAQEAGPVDPRVLYAVASREIASGTAKEAVPRLAQCVAVFAGSADCQRALVAGLLELDRIDEAASAAEGAPLLEAWVQIAQGLDVEVPASAEQAGLRDYLAGLRAAAAGDVDGVEAAMSVAREALSTSPAPELQPLGARALAVLVEHGRSRLAASRARELQALGATDPMIHVRLSRYYRSIRRRSEAEQHLGHATQLAAGRDNAPALYALSELHRESEQPALAQDQLDQYLALSPSGPRAAAAAAAASAAP